ncbi:hypothetical protein EYC80_006989 [Monilinia laxa]|uniref:Uncharacterized protein n=1 Tax=Monilinia laxa TaxID=61186 RepID=A0A5N6JZV1_MONLA|nr:hypothetical protein EYC80_006989 [Monilinia laxa]
MDISTLPKLTGTLFVHSVLHSNEADMAKYKEVHDKQTALENMADREDAMSKSLFVGFTFRHRKPNTDDDGKVSPRKAIPTDGTFGTML